VLRCGTCSVEYGANGSDITFAAVLRVRAARPCYEVRQGGRLAELRPVDADYLLRVLLLEEGLPALLEEFSPSSPISSASRAQPLSTDG
jgi:hypothetical protein